MAFDKRSLDDYAPVPERIAAFREKYPLGTLQMVEVRMITTPATEAAPSATYLLYVAAAYRTPDDPRPGHGIAWEPVPGKTGFTRDSEAMNAETSAWGRAIIAVGAADAKRGIASAEEVRNRQDEAPPRQAPAQGMPVATWPNFGEFAGFPLTDIPVEWLKAQKPFDESHVKWGDKNRRLNEAIRRQIGLANCAPAAKPIPKGTAENYRQAPPPSAYEEYRDAFDAVGPTPWDDPRD